MFGFVAFHWRSALKVNGYTTVFLQFCKREHFCDFLFACLEDEAHRKGSTLKGKNLLQRERILFFKS